jgi:phenylalanyl-tRNA synthetase beta chain
MQSRLLLSGLKPINNIVDTLNYVMVELGQPLHAFDFEKLPALKSNRKEITARPADEGEVMLGLDGVLYTMKYGDIVIVDSLNTPIALAGIIGGQDSAISDSTTKVVIEAATFLGPQIRRTSRAHGVRTEASTRFEKGLDPELTVRALKRVVYLLNEQFGEIRCSQITDVYPSSKREIPRLHVTFDEVQQVIGVHISSAETKVILQKLGFQISHFSKSSFAVSPPTWRADIKLKEDIIEELVRIWGYDRIPATLPSGPVKAPIPNQSFVRKQQVRHLLAQLGGHETIHQTLCSLDALKRSGYSADQAISIPHPLSQETEHLIPSHLVPFLQNLGGVNSLETEITLFEIGHVFMPPYAEDERLSIIWRSSGEGELLYQRAKMALARLSGVLQLPTDFTFNYPEQGGEYPAALEGKSVVEILSASAVVGHLGLLKTSVLDAWKIRSGRTMLFMELSLKNILAIPSKPRLFVEPPLFPGSERDLSFVVDRSLAVALVEQAVQDAMDTTICQSAKITNIYTGKPIPDDKKSVTFHFTYNALTRTLTDEEIQKDQDTVIKALHRLFSSTIRQ